MQYHFGTKEALWGACVDQRAAPMLAMLDRFLAEDSVDIAELAEARFRLHQQFPQVGRLLAWASLTPTPIPAPIADRRAKLLEHFHGDQDDPRLLKLLFAFASIDGYFLFRNLYRRIAGDRIAAPEAEQRLLKLMREVTELP